ncbi:hypothetical protein [Rhizobium phage RHph_X3_2]|nr:hypothetical protein [Rhizobium phage RHph_X3_2]
MRDVDPNLQLALENAPFDGLVPRRLVYMTGKSFDTGLPTSVAFWSGYDEQTFTVESPDDDTTFARAYVGGVDLQTGSIPLVSDLTIQTVSISLNALHPAVQNFVRGSDIRLGKVQIHDVVLSAQSRNAVSTAPLVFLGEIDGSPIDIQGANTGEATVTIRAVSDVISMLSRTNPAKSSFQEQMLRDADEFGKYAATVSTWQVSWGQASS